MSMLVTGFGPFLTNSENPSADLAEQSGHPFEVLEVSFQAVDDFIGSLDPRCFDQWLMIGLSGQATKMNLETVARNHIGATPDVRGEQHGPGPISPGGPPQIAASLWRHPFFQVENEAWKISVDAGAYLCNYLLYRGLSAFPDKQIGFLHVPKDEVLSLDAKALTVAKIIQILTSNRS